MFHRFMIYCTEPFSRRIFCDAIDKEKAIPLINTNRRSMRQSFAAETYVVRVIPYVVKTAFVAFDESVLCTF